MDPFEESMGNPAGFADVPCVRYYRVIRDGVSADARQIGYGVNRTMPAVVVQRWLGRLYRDFLGERVTDYDTAAGQIERALLAWLAGRYLGVEDLSHDNVVLCNGSSEAISIVMAYAGRHGLEALLPLPLYFSFEQSSSRHNVRIAGYYNLGGEIAAPEPFHPGRLLLVDVAPNGVTGSWAATPHTRDAALTVIDHVFALPTYEPPSAFLRNLRTRVDRLERSVVLLTPSKDLSIPGVRCGTLVTKDADLLAHVAADRFERGYTVHGATVRVSCAHLALLLLSFEPPRGRARLVRELRQRFADAGLLFLSDDDVDAFHTHLAGMGQDFRDNILRLDRSGLFHAVPQIGEQAAGYSGFRRLDTEFRSADELTEWIRRAGHRGMKLNPNYLFGADADVWNRLYPNIFGVRVNVSVPPRQLAADLVHLHNIVQNQDLAV
ncbi:aminotransferase class I/II-fold pyridoxal phosphate-dependent enzyme [Nocardia sp. Marseille-Q1738]